MGWVRKKFSDVCTLQRGFDLPKRDRKSGVFPLISSSGHIDFHNEAKVKGPGVVTGRSGSIGQVFYIENDFWPLNTSLYIKNFNGNDPRFIFYLLESFDLSRYTSGTGVPTLNRNHVHDEIVFVPTEIGEQKRIVGILDQAFADIEQARTKTEQNLRNARELFESYLQQVFSQRGEGWEELTLGQATGGVCTGPFGSLLHKSDYIENGIPLVNPAHITMSGIEPDSRKTVSEENADRLSNYIMRQGDIVIGRRGEMGRCALITEKEDGFLCGTGSFSIKASERFHAGYLVRYLRSSNCKSRLEKIAGGAVMPNLSNTDLSNLTLSLPSTDKQKKIVEMIDLLAIEIETIVSIYQKKLTALDELKKSILQKAFTGQLTSNKTKGAAA